MTKKQLLTLTVLLLSPCFATAGTTSGPSDVVERSHDIGFPVVDSYQDFLDSLNVQNLTDDNQMLGVEYDGSDYWVTGAGGTEHPDTNYIYQISRTGQLVGKYIQETTSDWGWRDLAWDGTYLYASDEQELVKFLPPAPLNKIPLTPPPGYPMPCRALAYDPATGHLWTGNFRYPIVEFDPNTGEPFCVAGNSNDVYGMAWDDACYDSLGYDHPMLWVFSQNGTPELKISLFDPVTCEYTGEEWWGLDPFGDNDIAGGAAFDLNNYSGGLGALITMNQGVLNDDMIMAYEICSLTGVSMRCNNLTPVFCRGRKVYFQVTTTNTTGAPFDVNLVFNGYRDHGCDPANSLVTIQRVMGVPQGTNTNSYLFKVPNAAAPGPYSMSVSFTHEGTDYFCCMNTTCVQCQPWRVGDNTEWEVVEVDRLDTALPTAAGLHQNYPNPFNATTNIGYDLAEAGNVTLKVYHLAGRLVETLFDGLQEAGEHVVSWDASSVASGLYFYKLTAGDFSETERMILVR